MNASRYTLRIKRIGAYLLLLSMWLSACAFNQISDTEKRTVETNIQLAIGYLKKGKLDIAEEKVLKALEIQWDSSDAHTAAALIYDALLAFEQADKHYQYAIEFAPESGAAYNNYGVFLCKQKRWKKSVEFFLKAADMPRYPTKAHALENAGSCAMQIPDLALAESYLRKALKSNPKLPTALLDMAQISFSKKKHLSVRAYLQRYEEVASHTAQSLWLGIQAERHLGNQQEASRYAKLLQTRFPDSNEFKLLLQDSEQKRAGS